MASPKRKPKTMGKAVNLEIPIAIVDAAIRVLDNPAVRKFLETAPAHVVIWAKNRASELRDLVNKRDKLTNRFGQKGLERRLAGVREGFNVAFPTAESPGRAEVLQALDALQTALLVANPLPLLKRKRAHFAIDNQLDRLEHGLIDAVIVPLKPRASEQED